MSIKRKLQRRGAQLRKELPLQVVNKLEATDNEAIKLCEALTVFLNAHQVETRIGVLAMMHMAVSASVRLPGVSRQSLHDLVDGLWFRHGGPEDN